jgi:hypothetical protein
MAETLSNEKFYKLPQELAARKNLKASDKIVYAVIMDHMSVNNKCFPGKRRIMERAGLSGQTVCDSIKRLETAGAMEVVRCGTGKKNHYKSGLENGPVQKADQSKSHTSTGLKTRPEAVQKLDHNQTDINNQTIRLAVFLFDSICKIMEDFKKPDLEKWAEVFGKMIHIDNRKPEQIQAVIKWGLKDIFWRDKLLSPDGLRKHFDRLKLKMDGGLNQNCRDCVECGTGYVEGKHKFTINKRTNKKEYLCENCRKNKNLENIKVAV